MSGSPHGLGVVVGVGVCVGVAVGIRVGVCVTVSVCVLVAVGGGVTVGSSGVGRGVVVQATRASRTNKWNPLRRIVLLGFGMGHLSDELTRSWVGLS